MLRQEKTYSGFPIQVVCDGNCQKAWGMDQRPKIQLDPADEDDYAYLADGELGSAPVDSETSEGGDGKPVAPDDRLNKWCVRQCERSEMGPRWREIVPLDFSRRVFNIPGKHLEALPSPEPGTFEWALTWVKRGACVRRRAWYPHVYIALANGQLLVIDPAFNPHPQASRPYADWLGDPSRFEDLLATDWALTHAAPSM